MPRTAIHSLQVSLRIALCCEAGDYLVNFEDGSPHVRENLDMDLVEITCM